MTGSGPAQGIGGDGEVLSRGLSVKTRCDSRNQRSRKGRYDRLWLRQWLKKIKHTQVTA